MHVSFLIVFLLCVPTYPLERVFRSVPFQTYMAEDIWSCCCMLPTLGKNYSSYLLKVCMRVCVNFKMMSIRINSLPRVWKKSFRFVFFFLILVPSIKLRVWWCILLDSFGSAFDDAQRRRSKQMLVLLLPKKPSSVRGQLRL